MKYYKRVAILCIVLIQTACFFNGEKIIRKEVYLENKNIKGLSLDEIRIYLEDISIDFNKEPVDSDYDRTTWDIIPGENGRKINIEKTIDSIKNAKKGDRITYVYDEIQYNEQDTIFLLAEFSTEIISKNKGRVNNITIACKALDKTVLDKKEVLSFNEALGERSYQKGYMDAPVMQPTEEGTITTKGVGGGICQVSTTLYNAALGSNLEIIERHPHSKSVNYIAPGKDATVVYGAQDLKIRNNRSQPIMLKTKIVDDKVYVAIIENRKL